MSVEENVQIVKAAFAAFGRGDIQGLLALAEDIECISPGGRLPPNLTRCVSQRYPDTAPAEILRAVEEIYSAIVASRKLDARRFVAILGVTV